MKLNKASFLIFKYSLMHCHGYFRIKCSAGLPWRGLCGTRIRHWLPQDGVWVINGDSD